MNHMTKRDRRCPLSHFCRNAAVERLMRALRIIVVDELPEPAARVAELLDVVPAAVRTEPIYQEFRLRKIVMF